MLGAVSYGIYLWHYPVIVLTSPANAPEDLPRFARLKVEISTQPAFCCQPTPKWRS